MPDVPEEARASLFGLSNPPALLLPMPNADGVDDEDELHLLYTVRQEIDITVETNYFNGLYAAAFLSNRPYTEEEGTYFSTVDHIPQPSEIDAEILDSVGWYADDDAIIQRKDGIYLRYRSSDDTLALEIVSLGQVETIDMPMSIVPDTDVKIAASWSSNRIRLALNGNNWTTVGRISPAPEVVGLPIDIGSLAGAMQIDGAVGPVYLINSETLSNADIAYLNALTRPPDIYEDEISPRRRALWKS